MTPKPEQNSSKVRPLKATKKAPQGAAETARLFINVNEVVRQTQKLALTRYVE